MDASLRLAVRGPSAYTRLAAQVLARITHLIEEIRIQNYKSVEDIRLSLGRVNVFIGENGAGKSNVLEAIALAAAAEAGKLDNEFLASRGVRVSNPRLMRSAFNSHSSREPIFVTVRPKGGSNVRYEISNDNKPYSAWTHTIGLSSSANNSSEFTEFLRQLLLQIEDKDVRTQVTGALLDQLSTQLKKMDLQSSETDDTRPIRLDLKFSLPSKRNIYQQQGLERFDEFLIYSPENSTLRLFEREGQIEPLGINGEGLLRFLGVIASAKDKLASDMIKEGLKLFGWFDDYKIRKRRGQLSIDILDQYIDAALGKFDQKSVNEGFLFVAFYFALLSSELTPRFLAIDNMDTALNPKLCEELTRRVVSLAKNADKQLIITTHNPAILDGLNLSDDEQRLFVVSRKTTGQTKVRRFEEKPSLNEPSRLSELFIKGFLGGIPKGF